VTSFGKLKLLIIRDLVSFVALALCFFIPAPLGFLPMVASVWLVARPIRKRLEDSDAKLRPAQKRTYFATTFAYFATLLGLLLSWIIRHAGPPAWTIGSVGILFLLAYLYSSYDTVYGRNAKV
jgi:hypothetical protein